MSILVNSEKADIEPVTTFPAQSQRYPKSFLNLILFGFSLVGLPLIGALIYIAIAIDQLADFSQKTVYQATDLTSDNRALVDEVLAMERSMRQAMILSDLSLLEGYFRAHENFNLTAKKLLTPSPRPEQRILLEKLRLYETSIFREVLSIQDNPEDLRKLVDSFASLLNSARTFSTFGHSLIELDVNEMQDMAEQANTVVKWQLIALIPFVILLALVFSLLIARPIRQIDEAIYTMGQGELSKPVRVRGPQNLIYLGERLDWMRRRLLKLEEQKIQFLRHVSHELKTPLTSIREGVDLLAEGVTGKLTEKQQQIANILHNSSIQLQKRIEDLLSYSALQTEKSALVKHQTNLAKILDEVLQNQNLSIMSKNLKILRNCPALLLDCDKEKIKIIMDNLISNAIKFSPQNSCIEIILTQTNGSIQLDITDAGIGIHETDQEKIFEPFYQGKSAPNAHVKGTGLGLSIAREYALAHGGNLELIQKVGEEGAHFQLTLPASEPKETA
jgi:two-component system, NtrC family, sensor histidine kinase GlrK